MLFALSVAGPNATHFENFVAPAKRSQRGYRRFHNVCVIA